MHDDVTMKWEVSRQMYFHDKTKTVCTTTLDSQNCTEVLTQLWQEFSPKGTLLYSQPLHDAGVSRVEVQHLPLHGGVEGPVILSPGVVCGERRIPETEEN